MSQELEQRLRQHGNDRLAWDGFKAMSEAADMIAAQRKRIADLEAGLKPFVDAAHKYEKMVLGEDIDHWPTQHGDLTLGDLRFARELLEGRIDG